MAMPEASTGTLPVISGARVMARESKWAVYLPIWVAPRKLCFRPSYRVGDAGLFYYLPPLIRLQVCRFMLKGGKNLRIQHPHYKEVKTYEHRENYPLQNLFRRTGDA